MQGLARMSRYSARIRQLEKRLGPEPQRPPVVVLWLMFDGDVPAWATEAIRPYLPTGDAIVMWHQAPSTGELGAEVNGRWYAVSEAGVERKGAPLSPNPFTLELDNPNEAGE